MHRYIALLRGINMLGKNSLPMAELTAIFESLGYTSVKTYIQSGNVIFESEKEIDSTDMKAVSDAVNGLKGFRPAVLLIDEEKLRYASDNAPFPTDVGKALHVYFLSAEAKYADPEKMNSVKTATEDFRLLGDVFYLYTPDGFGRSKLANIAEKCLGVSATARNWNTVAKLISMM
jgi:uncharacterized protein (DUF1697 family)